MKLVNQFSKIRKSVEPVFENFLRSQDFDCSFWISEVSKIPFLAVPEMAFPFLVDKKSVQLVNDQKLEKKSSIWINPINLGFNPESSKDDFGQPTEDRDDRFRKAIWK